MPASVETELEDWEAISIGDRSVMRFYDEIKQSADRLGKDAEDIRRCFLRGLRDDHPELWKQLRFGSRFEAPTAEQLVSEAKDWMETNRIITPDARVRRTAEQDARDTDEEDDEWSVDDSADGEADEWSDSGDGVGGDEY